MNISGGEFRGRKIKSVKGLEVRPTSEKIRQAFFNIVQNYIKESLFIDLCCGTGIMSFEALSRGAKGAILVDNGLKSIQTVKENISKLKVDELAIVINDNVVSYLNLKKIPIDKDVIIYFDPPYEKEKLYNRILGLFEKTKFQKSCIIAIEHKFDFELPKLETMAVWKTKRYGDKCITLFASFCKLC